MWSGRRSSRRYGWWAPALLFVLIGFGIRPWGASGQTSRLPEGPGVEKVKAFCSLCHGLDLIAQQRLNRAGWTRIVDQMVEFGAPVLPDTQQEILTYLITFLGPEGAQSP
ncbi:MAG: hypothetical protein E8D45_12030 [Nitrospira sp.]|nr:MAG: hypothetical protein E8D45_12030 [Nitrospira sp.]